ncbi:unnamed protein product [Cunninghamella blakesleeana]
MDHLPNEILCNLLTYLPQRYIFTICTTVCKQWYKVINQPHFYSTIHIYSKHQLETFIQLSIEGKPINNKHISYYVKAIKFYYDYKLRNDELFVFPNLHYVDELYNDRLSAHNFYSVYLQCRQPTHYIYWYLDEKVITKFKSVQHHLKSLHIYLTLKHLRFIHERLQQQQLETINMESTKEDLIERKRNGTEIKTPIKVMRFPTILLKNLITIKIDFTCHIKAYMFQIPNYIIDERTFENIHQACPLLESLFMEDFYMTISDSYHMNQIIPTHHIKNIHIMSRFHHYNCFQYLAIKYPRLESLSLLLRYKDLSSSLEEIKHFQDTILNMLHQFPILKKFAYKYKYEHDQVWPTHEFIKWLNQHPNQLESLEYSFPLVMNIPKKLIDLSDNNNNDLESQVLFDFNNIAMDNNNNNNYNNNNNNIPLLQKQQLKQFDFLNHLASLTIAMDDGIDFIFAFFAESKEIDNLSTSLKELDIRQHNNRNTDNLLIYDWLDILPNLEVFKLGFNGYITDDLHFIKRNDDNRNNQDQKSRDDIIYKLHQLIKERKQQQQQFSSLKKMMVQHYPIYKLKHLKISESHLWFRNGFDDLLKKCCHLKTLELNDITFVNPFRNQKEIQLDLSHLQLELLKMKNISYDSFIHLGEAYSITKFIIHETLMDRIQIIEYDKSKNHDQQYILNLKSKFIDGFVYE